MSNEVSSLIIALVVTLVVAICICFNRVIKTDDDMEAIVCTATGLTLIYWVYLFVEAYQNFGTDL